MGWVFDTPTEERVRISGSTIEVGLSALAQKELGELIHAQLPKIGEFTRMGEQLGVVEGTLTAAEFYAPCNGIVIFVAKPAVHISDWLVTIEKAPHAKA